MSEKHMCDPRWRVEVSLSWAIAWLSFDAASAQPETGTRACRTWNPPQQLKSWHMASLVTAGEHSPASAGENFFGNSTGLICTLHDLSTV